MSSNLRDKILNSDDISSKVVDIPEWDVEVEVRSITAGDRADLIEQWENGRVQAVYPELLLRGCYDPETGERLFEPADRDTLMSKESAAVERLANAVVELSGLAQPQSS